MQMRLRSAFVIFTLLAFQACNSNSDSPTSTDGNAGFFAPDAQDDAIATAEETPVIVDVVANDLTNGESIDPDSVQVITPPDHGSLVPIGGGSFTYTPGPDYYNVQASLGQSFPPDFFTYTVASVGGSVSDPATVLITVTDINDGPVAGDDIVVTNEDTLGVLIDIFANDQDTGANINVAADGTLNAASVVVDDPANGSASWDGSFITYTPDADFDETDVFGYTVEDDDGALTSATVTVIVVPVNDAPILGDDALATEKNLPLAFGRVGLMANDAAGPDPWETDGSDDLNELTFVVDEMVEGRLELDNGLILLVGEGLYFYYPDPNSTAGDTFTYTVFDTGDSGAAGGALGSTATVTVTVTDRNTPPVCENDYDPHLVGLVTDEDTALNNVSVSPLLANDTDMDSPALDPTTFSIVDPPNNGDLTNNGDGTFNYVPDPNFFGTDSFTYVVSDSGYDGSDGDGTPFPPAEAEVKATVHIYVGGVNDAPEANDDAYTVGKNSVTLVTVNLFDPLENDTGGPGEHNSDAPDRATLVFDSFPAGDVSFNPVTGIVTYTPIPDFFGTDVFTYHFTEIDNDPGDGIPPLESNIATVTITVVDRNTPPAAVDDIYAGVEDVELLTLPAVWTNDSDPDFQAGSGTAFECSAFAATNGLDPATVRITALPAHGVIVNMDPSTGIILDPDGTIEYQPGLNRTDAVTFQYVIADCHGAESNPATVSVSLSAINDEPTADDGDAQVNENGCGPVDPDNTVTGDLHDLASDVDSDLDSPLTVYTLVEDVDLMSGGLLFSVDGTWSYTPDEDFSDPPSGVVEDSFTWTVTDPEGEESTVATFTIEIIRNTPPVANLDSYEVFEDSAPITVNLEDLLGNDYDVDGPALRVEDIILVQHPGKGHWEDNFDGTWSIDFDPDWCGTDFLTYRVLDNDCDTSEVATVEFTVVGVNDPPDLVDDVFLAPQWQATPITLDVLVNDTDQDNEDPNGCGSTAPAWSNLTIVPGTDPTGSPGVRELVVVGGVITLVPEPCDITSDITFQFEYLVEDSGGLRANVAATVTVTLVFDNACPVVVDDSAVVEADLAGTGQVFILIPVLDNDSDEEVLGCGDITIEVFPEHGALDICISSGGDAVMYVPEAGYVGPDRFSYYVTDGAGHDSARYASVIVLVGTTDTVYIADADQDDQDELWYALNARSSLTNIWQINAPLGAGGNVTSFVLSPDGSLLLHRADQDTDGLFELYKSDIRTIASDTTPPVPEPVNIGVAVEEGYVFSPDSSTVVYRAINKIGFIELHMIDLASGVVTDLNDDLTIGGEVNGFDVTPDFSSVIYNADQDTVGQDELYKVDLASLTFSKISALPTGPGADVTMFAVKPDGSSVLYLADNTTDDALDLYAARLVDGVVTQLSEDINVNENVTEFVVAPDSTAVIYRADSTDNEFALWQVSGLGSGGPSSPVMVHEPLDAGEDVRPGAQYSPDGAWLYYRGDFEVDDTVELFRTSTETLGVSEKVSGALVAGGNVSVFAIGPANRSVTYIADQDVDQLGEAWWVSFDPDDADELLAPVKLSADLVAGGNCLSLNYGALGMCITYLADQDTDEVFELYFVDIFAHTPLSPVKVNEPLPTEGDVKDGYQPLNR